MVVWLTATGVASVLGDANAVVEDFGAGVGIGVGVGFEAFAVGEGIGDGSGVAPAFGLELEARAAPGPVLLAEFELPALRADSEFGRPAAFLFADAGAFLFDGAAELLLTELITAPR